MTLNSTYTCIWNGCRSSSNRLILCNHAFECIKRLRRKTNCKKIERVSERAKRRKTRYVTCSYICAMMTKTNSEGGKREWKKQIAEKESGTTIWERDGEREKYESFICVTKNGKLCELSPSTSHIFGCTNPINKYVVIALYNVHTCITTRSIANRNEAGWKRKTEKQARCAYTVLIHKHTHRGTMSRSVFDILLSNTLSIALLLNRRFPISSFLLYSISVAECVCVCVFASL